jgi:hypothetical protein
MYVSGGEFEREVFAEVGAVAPFHLPPAKAGSVYDGILFILNARGNGCGYGACRFDGVCESGSNFVRRVILRFFGILTCLPGNEGRFVELPAGVGRPCEPG